MHIHQTVISFEFGKVEHLLEAWEALRQRGMAGEPQLDLDPDKPALSVSSGDAGVALAMAQIVQGVIAPEFPL